MKPAPMTRSCALNHNRPRDDQGLRVPASNRLCDQRDSPMNITSPILSPILAGAARVAELPGDSVTSWLKMIGATTGLFDDSPDGGLGLVMSALAGVAAALAVAIVLSVYF